MQESIAKKIYRIADELGEEEILCQLSEECAELVQACLKYRRATRGLTPKTEDAARGDLFEELADVLLIVEQVLYLFENKGYDIIEHILCVQNYKADRWLHRTFEKEGFENGAEKR